MRVLILLMAGVVVVSPVSGAEDIQGVSNRGANALRVMTYNVEKGSPAEKIAADILKCRPDVALLQEVDCKTLRAGGQDQLPLISKALGLFGYYAPSYSVDGGTTGHAILSCYPLAQTETIKLEGSRNIGAMATIRWRGKEVTLLSTHWSSTYKVSLTHLRESEDARVREAQHLAGIVAKKKGLVIVGGDFNCQPGSKPYAALVAVLSPLGPENPTLPAGFPVFRFDHVLGSAEFRSVHSWVGQQGTSDHLPVVTDLVVTEKPRPIPAGPESLRVITWNIQYGRDKGADQNGWPKRAPALEDTIGREKPDVFCAQEVLPDQLSALVRLFPHHGLVAAGREDGKSGGEHCPVFFDKRVLTLIDGGTFWLSDTPEIPSRTWGNKYPRICTWVHLRSIRGEREFRVWNVHFPLGAEQRRLSAELLARQIEREAVVPTLVVGDFNEWMGPTSWPILQRVGLRDCFERSEKTIGKATFRLEGIGVARIDWVLSTPEWRVRELRTLDQTVGGVYPSDHNGVLAVLDLPAAGPDVKGTGRR